MFSQPNARPPLDTTRRPKKRTSKRGLSSNRWGFYKLLFLQRRWICCLVQKTKKVETLTLKQKAQIKVWTFCLVTPAGSLRSSAAACSEQVPARVLASPHPLRKFNLWRDRQKNSPTLRLSYFSGEPTHIILEPLFDDLFALKDRFEALGMIIKDGKVYLPDLEEFND